MRALALLALFGLVACGRSERDSRPPADSGKPKKIERVDTLHLGKSERPGVVAGHVRFTGRVPPPVLVQVQRHAEACGASKLLQELEVSGDLGVRWAVVELRGQGPAPVLAPRTLGVAHARCEFVPQVQAAHVGDTLTATTEDPVMHVLHAYLDAATMFRMALPPKAPPESAVLTSPGAYELRSDVGHKWMRAFVYVSEWQHVAVTDAGGAFEFDGVAPGTYTLHVWHTKLGEYERPDVQVGPEGLEIELQYAGY